MNNATEWNTKQTPWCVRKLIKAGASPDEISRALTEFNQLRSAALRDLGARISAAQEQISWR